jgi:hypothetical protein
MSEELIDSYVDRPAVSDDTKFITGELKSVLDLFDKVSAKKINLGGSKGMKDITTAAKELKAVLDSLQKTADAYNKTQIAEAKLKKEQALAAKAEAQARKENAAAAQKEQQASDSAAKSKSREQKVIDDIANEYLQLSKAYSDAALKAKNYALTLGENHPITVQAVKDAKAMHDILLRVDQSVGQSGRNVGNYKSAFDGLGVSVSQIARELPSLAVSAQTFTLAISNNIPMLFDELKKARVEMGALRAEGKEAPSVLRRLISSTLSWNVALSVGVALLTILGPKLFEWVGGLFDSEAAAKKAAKQQQELNERLLEGIELRNKYEATITRDSGTVSRGLENQIAYARAAGKSDAEVLKLEKQLLEQRQLLAQTKFFETGGEAELDRLSKSLNDARYEYQALLDTQPRSYDIFGNMSVVPTEKDKEKLGDLKKNFDTQTKLFNDQKGIVEEYYNANRDAQIKDIELQKVLSEQRAKFFADELQYRADILKKFSEIDESPETTRVNARKQAVILEREIIRGQYADELREAKDNQVKIFEANRDYAFKKKKLQEDYERDILAIHQTSIAQRREMEQRDNELFYEFQEERLNKEIDNLQLLQAKRQEEEAKGQEAEVKALNNWYDKKVAATIEGSKKREKVDREYAERRADIEYRYALAELKNQIDFAEKILKARKGVGIDVTNEETKLHELRMQLSDLETKRVVDNNKRQAKSQKEKLDNIKGALEIIQGLESKASNIIGTLISNQSDAKKNELQGQIDLINQAKDKEIDAVNASLASQQDKAAQIAIINARAASDKEQLERKQRQLDLQRARFDKAANIARITIETALAVVHQLGTGDPYTAIPRAIAAGALGAAELAVAIAAPLPKFKDGRQDGPATWGVTGDGGKREVVTSPDLSQAFVTPDTDTLTYLPKSWKVFPDIDAFQEAAVNMVHKPLPAMPIVNNNNDGLIHAMAYSIGRLERAVMNKQETHFHWDNGELRRSIQNGNDWLRYIQNNI